MHLLGLTGKNPSHWVNLLEAETSGRCRTLAKHFFGCFIWRIFGAKQKPSITFLTFHWWEVRFVKLKNMVLPKEVITPCFQLSCLYTSLLGRQVIDGEWRNSHFSPAPVWAKTWLVLKKKTNCLFLFLFSCQIIYCFLFLFLCLVIKYRIWSKEIMKTPELNTLHYQRKTKAANAINNLVVHELFKSEYTCYCKELSQLIIVYCYCSLWSSGIDHCRTCQIFH